MKNWSKLESVSPTILYSSLDNKTDVVTLEYRVTKEEAVSLVSAINRDCLPLLMKLKFYFQSKGVYYPYT